MLVLFETAGGYALFKVLNESKLSSLENLFEEFLTVESANKVVTLKHFQKFSDTTDALAATTAVVESKLCKPLKKLLKKHCLDAQETLAVADAKLGSIIKDKLNLQCVNNNAIQELMRCIRAQIDGLITGFPKESKTAMALGLSHSLSRFKLKFSPDKVDTMIVQAISLLDYLDKQLNIYIMRCREWYGWHFPELGKIISDNLAFVKTLRLIGAKENAANVDLSDVLSEELEEQVKEAAQISMGSQMSQVDVIEIQDLCDQVTDMSESRTQLYDYLKSRMMAMAPNLTVLVGDLVGARLISHAGSLINLAKHPASTVQILGAEKALFRALKTKKDTPKYGLIYHAQLVGQASTKNKGKMSRMLAAKTSLATRVDALGDDSTFDLGMEHRAKLEARLRMLEEGNIRRISGTGKAKAKFEKYHSKNEFIEYPEAADSTISSKKRPHSQNESRVLIEEIETNDEPKKKKSKKVHVEEEVPETSVAEAELDESVSKKKKKRKKQEVEEEAETSVQVEQIEIDESEQSLKQKKKKKSKENKEATDAKSEEPVVEENTEPIEKKKKKKKKTTDQ